MRISRKPARGQKALQTARRRKRRNKISYAVIHTQLVAHRETLYCKGLESMNEIPYNTNARTGTSRCVCAGSTYTRSEGVTGTFRPSRYSVS